MTAKPPAPSKGIPASAVATVILIILAFIIGAILLKTDGKFNVEWLDELPGERTEMIRGGDGVGPAAGEGQPDTCAHNCKDDNP